MGSKGRTSKLLVRTAGTAVNNKNAALQAIATSGNTIVTDKINSSIKKNDGNNSESLKPAGESHNASKNASSVVSAKQSGTSTFSGVRSVSTCVNSTAHENPMKSPKDYAAPKKFPVEADTGIKSYQSDYKESVSVNSPDYKNSRNSGGSGSGSGGASITGNLPLRFAAQQSSTAPGLHRENHTPSTTYTQSGIPRNEHSSAFAVARKALEQQQNSVPKMAPINFPPLRAPQSIVNVRHPLLTDARAKHASETVGGPAGGGKSKLNVMSSLQAGVKDLTDHGRTQTTYHGYGTSPIAAAIPSGIQNLSNAVTASISPYPRPDSFPQPTVASVLFSDTAAQFPQSPPFSTTQLGQLNQYQTYDPGSFATTPVNVNPVIPQFSAESSIPYPQYENPPQFVPPNHYPTADMTNSQYQYQAAAAAAAGVGQIQDSSMFIQSLQSPIAVTDQYAAPNYARAVRTDLIPRRLRPPRFNK
ncbi:hypothetical protein DMN91_010735 [Ooceraea biroi]|uniref:Uncharacterized protein n=1 Tax=Ooceraea biroi TaxID=2015173 RepID=A0A026X2R2_OOCBI|nr:uncharacterized protein LOC113562947 [Ooceraea biroi]EZA62383.1 hypothetical protein X777_03418 [Ooceraea biroi]RLU16667.1 hypothetical protein DMN91_010735 [Ooceraea biroi]